MSIKIKNKMAAAAPDRVKCVDTFNSMVLNIFGKLIKYDKSRSQLVQTQMNRISIIIDTMPEEIITKAGPRLAEYSDDILMHIKIIELEKQGKPRPTDHIYGVDRFFINTENHELEAIGSKKKESKTNKAFIELFNCVKNIYLKLEERDKEYYRILTISLYNWYIKYVNACLRENKRV